MPKVKGTYFPPAFDSTSERVDWIRHIVVHLSYESSSAHLGSSLSVVEIIDTILLLGMFEESPSKDRLILSKGHAAMAFYAALVAHRLMDPELLRGYLSNGSALWGHVTRSKIVPMIDASTGSLGHGLSLACGHSYGDRLRRRASRNFVVLSDGECDEGSTWEAASFAGHHGLNGILAIVDSNKIQGFGRCNEILNKEPLSARWESFGWEAIEVDGHDVKSLDTAFERQEIGGKPKVVIAHTVKGRGISRIEDTLSSHYIPALAEDIS